MNKIGILLILSLFAIPLVFAAEQNSNATLKGNNNELQINISHPTGLNETIMINVNNHTVQVDIENKTKLKVHGVEAESELEVNQEQGQNETRLVANLSNGKNALIKVMPDTASETAIARLGLKVCNESNNCTIVLKEVGQGNETKAAYDVNANKDVKIFGLINAKMKVEAHVDAETGALIAENVPWWAFLTTEA